MVVGAAGYTNVVDMNITVTTVARPVVRLSFTCNLGLGAGMPAGSGLEFQIYGSNTTYGTFLVGGSEVTVDDGVTADAGHQQYTWSAILDGADKIILGANTFFVQVQIGSGATGLVINPENNGSTPTCLAADEL
jgi:hypothetical protein